MDLSYYAGADDNGNIPLFEIEKHYATAYNKMDTEKRKKRGFTWTPPEYKVEIARRYDIDGYGDLTHDEAREWVFCFQKYLTAKILVTPTVSANNSLASKSNFNSMDLLSSLGNPDEALSVGSFTDVSTADDLLSTQMNETVEILETEISELKQQIDEANNARVQVQTELEAKTIEWTTANEKIRMELELQSQLELQTAAPTDDREGTARLLANELLTMKEQHAQTQAEIEATKAEAREAQTKLTEQAEIVSTLENNIATVKTEAEMAKEQFMEDLENQAELMDELKNQAEWAAKMNVTLSQNIAALKMEISEANDAKQQAVETSIKLQQDHQQSQVSPHHVLILHITTYSVESKDYLSRAHFHIND